MCEVHVRMLALACIYMYLCVFTFVLYMHAFISVLYVFCICVYMRVPNVTSVHSHACIAYVVHAFVQAFGICMYGCFPCLTYICRFLEEYDICEGWYLKSLLIDILHKCWLSPRIYWILGVWVIN